MCKHNYVNVIAHLTTVREPTSKKKVLRELLIRFDVVVLKAPELEKRENAE